jgi:SAM-dependent methyltransferase
VAADWEARYGGERGLDFTPEPLLVEVAERLPPGRALDLACGAGRHALYLAGLGWRVTAVDSSRAGIDVVRRRAADLVIEAVRADLEAHEFTIEPDAWDLICDFFYLQRDLFAPIRAGVRPGGVFVGAMHLFDDAPDARPRDPTYLLHAGELRAAFAGWKILYYSEGPQPGHRRRAARIVARKEQKPGTDGTFPVYQTGKPLP